MKGHRYTVGKITIMLQFLAEMPVQASRVQVYSINYQEIWLSYETRSDYDIDCINVTSDQAKMVTMYPHHGCS